MNDDPLRSQEQSCVLGRERMVECHEVVAFKRTELDWQVKKRYQRFWSSNSADRIWDPHSYGAWRMYAVTGKNQEGWNRQLMLTCDSVIVKVQPASKCGY